MGVNIIHTLLDGVTTTGAGSAKHIDDKDNFGVTVTYAGAAPTAATIKLQGSIDKTSWVDLGSTTDVSGTVVGFAVANKPYINIRGNLSAVTIGSCTGITVKCNAK